MNDLQYNCGSCHYFDNHRCHRCPPSVLNSTKGIFPDVADDEWCGEYEMSDAAQVKVIRGDLS